MALTLKVRPPVADQWDRLRPLRTRRSARAKSKRVLERLAELTVIQVVRLYCSLGTVE